MSTQNTLGLGVVAGEASGDMLAALLMGGLRKRWPALECFGVGGPSMTAQGMQAWWPQESLAVRGYVEVLRHYRRIATMRKALFARLMQAHASGAMQGFVGVDAPDFNLDLEAWLRARGVKTVHFICPSIWAWRGSRVHGIKRSADHVLCVFPFEPALLAKHGIEATYVGHPLADEIPIEAVDKAARRVSLKLHPERPVVALLPGSRASELDAMVVTFLQAADLIWRAHPQTQFVLPLAPGRRAQFEALSLTARVDVPITVVDGRSHDALAACDVTLIASGTATLEAMLFKRPMVVAYKMNGLSYQLMKRMGYLPWIGLPNILAHEGLVPERVQNAASPEALARDVLAWMDEPVRASTLVERFTALHHTLRCNTAQSATEAIARVLQR